MTENNMVDMFTFEALMNQARKGNVGLNRTLYSLFPETAARGLTNIPKGTQPVSPLLLRKGALNVARAGGRRIPILAGGLQALGGDPIGGLGTAGGGIAGAMLGQALIPIPGVGALVGGVIGSGIGQNITRGAANLAGGVVGIDPNDPLSGPDWSLGGIALTPYAKSKKRTKRGIELAKMQLPLYNQIADEQLRRQKERDSLQQTSQLVSNILSSNPYMR